MTSHFLKGLPTGELLKYLHLPESVRRMDRIKMAFQATTDDEIEALKLTKAVEAVRMTLIETLVCKARLYCYMH